MKLSKAQADLVAAIKDGEWELATSTGIRAQAWIQKGGACKGGEMKTVGWATLAALKRMGAIKAVEPLPKDPNWLTRYAAISRPLAVRAQKSVNQGQEGAR